MPLDGITSGCDYTRCRIHTGGYTQRGGTGMGLYTMQNTHGAEYTSNVRGLHIEENSGEEALPQSRSHTKGTTHKGEDYLHPKKGTRGGDYIQRRLHSGD